MKWREGPRPWTIWGFVLAFMVAASFQLIQNFANPLLASMRYSDRFPAFEWTHDWVVVASSAEFTIALIPVIMIFGFAFRFARIFVAIFGALKLLPHAWDFDLILLSIELRPSLLVPPAAILLAICLLYSPTANRWLRKLEETNDASFE